MKKNYKDEYSDKKFGEKLSKYAKKAGVKVVYSALLLFYAYRRDDTPRWAKNIVIGTLGYLISPIDAIPDLTPLIGYTDDVGVLSFGLVAIAAYVNKEVKEKARFRLTKWFGEVSDEDISDVDDQL